MYVPLYRQEKDWKRQGLFLSRQVMSEWVRPERALSKVA